MSKNKTIFCDCSDMRDHVIDIRHYDDGDAWDDTITVSLAMNHYQPVWKRFWIALKYVLGLDNTYHHYVETVLSAKQAIELRDYLNDRIPVMAAANIPPLTEEQLEAIRKASPATDTPADNFDKKLFDAN